MTESEAIEWQKSFKKTYKSFPKDVDDACDMAINALEKIDNIKKIIDCTIICNDANKAKYDAIRKIVKE